MFLNRLKILMDEYCDGKQSVLAAKANLPKSVISSYFCRGSQPSLSQLVALSNAFNCTIDYLAGIEPDIEDFFVPGELTAPKLSDEERELLDTYRALSLKNKMHVSMYAQIRLEEQESDTRRRG